MRRLTLLLLLGCDPRPPIDYVAIEEGCTHTGGALETRDCCEGVPDYAPTCGGDPCACGAATTSVLACDCGPATCFDGEACVLVE